MESLTFTRMETLAVYTAVMVSIPSVLLAMRETTFIRTTVAVLRNLLVAVAVVAAATTLYAGVTGDRRDTASLVIGTVYYGVLAVVATLLLRWLRKRTDNHPTLSP